MATEKRLRTFISPVFHREPANPIPNQEPKLVPLPAASPADEPTTAPSQTYLLDELLGGGLLIPDAVLDGLRPDDDDAPEGHRGLFVLIVGPPGSGKSTLALELCYRLAINPNPGIGALGAPGISSIYISAESPTRALIQNAASFGWGRGAAAGTAPRDRIVPWEIIEEPDERYDAPVVCVYGREKTAAVKGTKDIKTFFDDVRRFWGAIRHMVTPAPRAVVLDSLNVLPTGCNRDEVLSHMTRTCSPGTLLLIAMLEGGDRPPERGRPHEHDRWQYAADVVIRVGQHFEQDYMTRKIQVVKARYQDHADGEHRLKINPGPTPGAVRSPMSPFIQEGGIFVFPSVHRYLSVARAKLSEDTARLRESVPSPFRALNEIIQSRGFPKSSCTAIVGSRGGMKSHLAYYTLLKFLADNPDERALIISLRDDEDAATDTLAEIVAHQKDESGKGGEALKGARDFLYPEKSLRAIKAFIEQKLRAPDRVAAEIGQHVDALHDELHKQAREYVRNLLTQDRLEILFFWPGYISPEEFFHLVLVSVDRAPEGKRPVSLVVVNGLEQLDARFPLCAREKMFVSGLVTLLCAKGTTNIVVSGGDPSAPPERGGVQSGLLPMADLIVESSFQYLPTKRVWTSEVWGDLWERVKGKAGDGVGDDDDGQEAHVVYQIVRGPGARECRRRALFYMGRDGDRPPLFPGSVTVRPLPEDFRPGQPL